MRTTVSISHRHWSCLPFLHLNFRNYLDHGPSCGFYIAKFLCRSTILVRTVILTNSCPMPKLTRSLCFLDRHRVASWTYREMWETSRRPSNVCFQDGECQRCGSSRERVHHQWKHTSVSTDTCTRCSRFRFHSNIRSHSHRFWVFFGLTLVLVVLFGYCVGVESIQPASGY